jgi:Fe-S cluster biosynthesis and repair protein YggX
MTSREQVPTPRTDALERWSVDYENAEGEPQHTVLSWLSSDPTKELPEVGEELVRRTDCEAIELRLSDCACHNAKQGQGDCLHFYGLQGHDVDVYGKPKPWCWWCWKQHQISQFERETIAQAEELARLLEELDRFVHSCCQEWNTCTKPCAPLAENWRMDAKRLQARLDAVESALRELVECKKLKDSAEELDRGQFPDQTGRRDWLLADYNKRKPLAWIAAIRALAQPAQGAAELPNWSQQKLIKDDIRRVISQSAQNVIDKCPDCGRQKAQSADDCAAGLCPKWYAVRDKEAEDDCKRAQGAAEPAAPSTE